MTQGPRLNRVQEETGLDGPAGAELREAAAGRVGVGLVWPPPEAEELGRWESISTVPGPDPPAMASREGPRPTPAPQVDAQASAGPGAPRSAAARRRPAAPVASRPSRARWTPAPPVVAIALLALSSAAAGFLVAVAVFRPGLGRAAVSSATASILVETDQPGALVTVDGRVRGTTPLELALPPGPRRLDVEASGRRRSVGIDIAAGHRAAYFFTLSAPEGAGDSRGDGALRPVRAARASPPDTRTTGVPAKPAAVPLAADAKLAEADAGPVATAGWAASEDGWLSVRSPASLELFEGGRQVGVSTDGPVRLAAGPHEVEVVSEELEFRATRSVVVPAGEAVAIDMEWPSGRVSFNADPWAEVWVGGRQLGETPLANVALPIGRHEVVFRHPQLGDRRAEVLVRRSTSSRVAVSFAR
jgi:hypothetical protein